MSAAEKFKATFAQKNDEKSRPIQGFVSKSILTSEDGASTFA